nr:glycosyltransferase family 39 protein [Gemmatimonadota bacterium]
GRARRRGARAQRGERRHGAGVVEALGALSRGRLAALLAVLVLVVYNANGREAYPTGDSRPTALIPLSILYQGNLDLNEYRPPGAPVGGPVRLENGRLVSNYSPVPAFLSLPVYLLAWPHRAEINGDILRWTPFFSKLAGSIFAALATAAFFIAASELASRPAAMLAALVLAFASPFWVSGGQTLGQHGLTVLCGSLGLLFLMRLERSGSLRWAFLAGLACALAVGVRLTNGMLFAAFLAYLLLYRRRAAAAFAAPVLVLGLPLALLLLSMLGGSGGGLEAFAFVARIGDQFGNPLGAGLPGLLVSPGEGLLTWSPIFVLLIAPVVSALRITRKASAGASRSAAALDRGSTLEMTPAVRLRLLVFCLATAAALLVLYSAYVAWWGGRTYGPRYVVDTLPFLLMPAAVGLGEWVRRRAFWAAFVALFLLSSYVQLLGAFRYPCRGDRPGDVRRDEERIWDWGRTDIELCMKSPRRQARDFETMRRLARMTWLELTP